MAVPGIWLAPSLLAGDLLEIRREVESVCAAGAKVLHFDVMDGHFVGNLSFGLPILAQLRSSFPKLRIEVHLMVSNPAAVALAYARAGADVVIFHVEAQPQPMELLDNLRSERVQAGLAISPQTPVDILTPYFSSIHSILLMGVEPGRSGQNFLPQTLSRAQHLGELLAQFSKDNPSVVPPLVEVDGGVSLTNIGQLVESGVNGFVAGQSVFGARDRAAAFAQLFAAAESGLTPDHR